MTSLRSVDFNQDDKENILFYKTYKNDRWSDLKNFSIDTRTVNDISFHVYNDELWCTWYSSLYRNVAMSEIYLGKFNGTGVEIMADMTKGENKFSTYRPTLSGYEGKIYVSWKTEAKIKCRSFNNGELGETKNLDKGRESFSLVYKNKLYILYQSYDFLDNSEFRIMSFDRKEWSRSYKITSHGSDDPRAFTYNGKLYTYWNVLEPESRKIEMKVYKK